MEKTEIKTEDKKSIRETLEGYADEWIGEGVKLLKRLQVAVMIVAVGWLIFALGALALLVYVVVQYFGA